MTLGWIWKDKDKCSVCKKVEPAPKWFDVSDLNAVQISENGEELFCPGVLKMKKMAEELKQTTVNVLHE